MVDAPSPTNATIAPNAAGPSDPYAHQHQAEATLAATLGKGLRVPNALDPAKPITLTLSDTTTTGAKVPPLTIHFAPNDERAQNMVFQTGKTAPTNLHITANMPAADLAGFDAFEAACDRGLSSIAAIRAISSVGGLRHDHNPVGVGKETEAFMKHAPAIFTADETDLITGMGVFDPKTPQVSKYLHTDGPTANFSMSISGSTASMEALPFEALKANIEDHKPQIMAYLKAMLLEGNKARNPQLTEAEIKALDQVEMTVKGESHSSNFKQFDISFGPAAQKGDDKTDPTMGVLSKIPVDELKAAISQALAFANKEVASPDLGWQQRFKYLGGTDNIEYFLSRKIAAAKIKGSPEQQAQVASTEVEFGKLMNENLFAAMHNDHKTTKPDIEYKVSSKHPGKVDIFIPIPEGADQYMLTRAIAKGITVEQLKVQEAQSTGTVTPENATAVSESGTAAQAADVKTVSNGTAPAGIETTAQGSTTTAVPNAGALPVVGPQTAALAAKTAGTTPGTPSFP